MLSHSFEDLAQTPSVTLVVRLINFNQTDKTENTYGLLQRRL